MAATGCPDLYNPPKPGALHMLDSQRPRISQSPHTPGGAGLLSSAGGRVVLVVAVICILAGGGFIIWNRARQGPAQEALAVAPKAYLPEGMVPASPPGQQPVAAAKPAGRPDPVAEQAPVVVSMTPPRAPKVASLPLEILEPSPATAQANPGAPQPAPTLAPKETTSPASAALPPDLGTIAAPPVLGDLASQGQGQAKRLLDESARLVQQNQLVLARTKLNAGLMDPRSTPAERAQIRAQIASINETLFFSPTVSAGDAITDTYTVASGDSLVRITRKQGLPIDWRLLQRINRLPSENALRVGQKIKIVRLPIHAVVHKNDYRMDLYAGSPPAGGSGTSDLGPDGQERDWVYIRSFRVGLGESNGTPEGTFVVRPNSKLVNPRWVNPRTGEVFEADNPANPIGERWIGLDGSDDNTRKFVGYGVHGTVDPDSIGQQRSMGCVRLASDDVAVVYELLVDRLSTVKIIK